jgi:hypothetical protein
VDTISTAATFGTMCPAQICTGVEDFNSNLAPFYYAGYTVDRILDVVRSTVLAAEVGWNQVTNLARVGAPTRQVLAHTAGPRLQAAGYGWRNTWMGVYGSGGCQSCMWAEMGVKFGPAGLQQRTGLDGWVVQESWNCTVPGVAYEAAPNRRNASAGQYMSGTPADCKAACGMSPACAGFSYLERNQTCYFVSSVVAMNPPAISLPSTSPNLAALGNGTIPVSCYSKGAPTPAVSAAAAWSACAGRCGRPPFWAVPPLTSADLDLLANLAVNITAGAQLEQDLENVLFAANRHPRMQGIFMDALERWRRVASPALGTVCMPPLDYTPGRWSFAGGWTKGTDNNDFAMRRSPTQEPAPKMLALRAWIAGEPQILPFTAEDDPALVAAAAAAFAGCSPACVWGICVSGTCSCFVGYEGADCSEVSATRPVNECQGGFSPVGVNLNGMSYWSTQWDYIDVFKKSGLGDTSSNQGWLAQDFQGSAWDTGQQLNISKGYPASLAPNTKAGRMMVRDLQRHGVSGVYIILWDGDGVITCSMQDVVRVSRPRPGRIDVLVQLSTSFNNGLFIVIERTNPLNPVRNIRVLTPGFGGGGGWGGFRGTPFHPAFIETLRRYRVLRFMDWQETNGVGAGTWQQRPKRTDTSYTTHGVPLEDMLLLANTVGADAWFCIPHLANDDYVRNFAIMVRDGLRPDRKAYIEYSNELWHTGFPGGQYADAQGTITKLGRFCFTVARMRNISRIFQDVFGAAARGRFVTVVSSQVVNADATRQILACNIGAAGVDIDAIGLAPYFDGFLPTLGNVSAIIASMDDGINVSLKLVQEHAALTQPRGFSLFTYEAGPGSPVGSLSELGISAHRDPRMRGLIRRYYEGLAALNVTLRMQFGSTGLPSKYGAFGLRESTDQDPMTAPKEMGLFDLLDSRAICAFPNVTTVDGGSCSGHGYYAGGEGGGTGCFCYYGYGGDRCESPQYTEHSSCGYYCTFDQVLDIPLLTRALFFHKIDWSARFVIRFFGLCSAGSLCPKIDKWLRKILGLQVWIRLLGGHMLSLHMRAVMPARGNVHRPGHMQLLPRFPRGPMRDRLRLQRPRHVCVRRAVVHMRQWLAARAGRLRVGLRLSRWSRLRWAGDLPLRRLRVWHLYAGHLPVLGGLRGPAVRYSGATAERRLPDRDEPGWSRVRARMDLH